MDLSGFTLTMVGRINESPVIMHFVISTRFWEIIFPWQFKIRGNRSKWRNIFFLVRQNKFTKQELSNFNVLPILPWSNFPQNKTLLISVHCQPVTHNLLGGGWINCYEMSVEYGNHEQVRHLACNLHQRGDQKYSDIIKGDILFIHEVTTNLFNDNFRK